MEVVDPPLEQKLKQFKCLLEYFVSHLEWEATHDRAIKGFHQYIEPNLGPDGELPKGRRRGNSNHGASLSQWISRWSNFGPGQSVGIAVVPHGAPNEKPGGCFINWSMTGHNIKAVWGKKHPDRVIWLYVCEYDGYDYDKSPEVSRQQLGLFDGQEPNDELKKFWLEFESRRLRDLPNNHTQQTNQSQAHDELEPLLKLLTSNHNLILTGAPGTGKTYLAKQLARRLVAANAAEPELMAAKLKAQTKLVQFHPSYDYTDFVEGLRPVTLNGQPSFEHRDGSFKKLCKDALLQPEDKFVLIIDEINRGEVSKIFGELFFALDPDYRGEEGVVETQYQNLIEEGDPFAQGFYVPKNVYVIGTMNDIDRSVESIDFAFRRRFAWHEVDAASRFHMLAEIEPFKSAPKFVQQVEAYFTALNHAIDQETMLGAAYQIGPAYFLKLKNFVGKANLNEASEDFVAEKMEQLWDNHLEPVLKEYVRGNSDESAILERLETAFFAHDATSGAPDAASDVASDVNPDAE